MQYFDFPRLFPGEIPSCKVFVCVCVCVWEEGGEGGWVVEVECRVIFLVMEPKVIRAFPCNN